MLRQAHVLELVNDEIRVGADRERRSVEKQDLNGSVGGCDVLVMRGRLVDVEPGKHDQRSGCGQFERRRGDRTRQPSRFYSVLIS